MYNIVPERRMTMMSVYNTLLTTIGGVAIVYIGKEIIYPRAKVFINNYVKRQKYNKKINTIMEDGISFEQAKQELLNERMAEHYEIELTSYDFFGKVINRGERVSFQTEEYGYISGKFLGCRECKAEGYTYNFFVWKNDDYVVSAPIEAIKKDTLMVYR